MGRLGGASIRRDLWLSPVSGDSGASISPVSDQFTGRRSPVFDQFSPETSSFTSFLRGVGRFIYSLVYVNFPPAETCLPPAGHVLGICRGACLRPAGASAHDLLTSAYHLKSPAHLLRASARDLGLHIGGFMVVKVRALGWEIMFCTDRFSLGQHSGGCQGRGWWLRERDGFRAGIGWNGFLPSQE